MKDWQILFWAAAFFNIAVGIPLFIAPDFMAATTGTVLPADPSLMKVTGSLIICFGIVYAIVAGNPARYRPIVWAGVMGKLGVALIYMPAWFQGSVSPGTILVTLCDIGFAAVFLYFLFRPAPKTGFRPDKAVS